MADTPANSTSSQIRQLVLTKKDQRWIFRYMPGEEQAVLRWLADTARDPLSNFDWFDAAVLCHQMGSRMGDALKKIQQGQD